MSEYPEARLRAFLLGTAGEEESERLEAAVIENHDLFEELRAVEDDLVDDFVAGRLPQTESEAVSKRYRSRIAFAQALALATQRQNVTAFRPRKIVWPLAAAAALVIAFGGYWATRRPSVPEQTPVARAPYRPATTLAQTVAVTFTLGTSRSEGKPLVIEVPTSASTVTLTIGLHPEDRFDEYVVRVGGALWTGQARDATLTATVPLDKLPSGVAEIAVSGRNRGGSEEELGFQTVEIRRQQ